MKTFAENPDDVKNFLIGDLEQGTSGILDTINTQLEANLDFETGYFAARTNSYNSQISSNNEKISRMKNSVEMYRKTLEKKFSVMDSLISSLNGKYTYLTSALSSLFTTTAL